MKKLLLTLVAMVALCSHAIADPTGDALTFRNSIQSFLREEGFSPYVDEDGDLCFKKEGTLYWIAFLGDTKPVYIRFHRASYSTEGLDKGRILQATNDVARGYRAIKPCLSKDGDYVSFACESYIYVPEDFKYCFYKYLDVLEEGRDLFKEAYDAAPSLGGGSGYSSSTPMTYNSASVRNENGDGEAISDWGATIYAYRTRYLTPKINVNVKTAGDYEIYVKMYGPNGLTTGSNSPSGYSYKSKHYFGTGNREVKLTGWGSNTAGHWKAGNYRFEFYLNGRLLGTKYFTVK